MKNFYMRFMEQKEEGNDLPAIEETKDADAQAIIDRIEAEKNEEEIQDEEEVELPSDGQDEEDDSPDSDDKLYAGSFKSIDELKKGIENLKSELPQYIIDGMSDEALEQHYTELRKDFSNRGKDEKKSERRHSEDEKKDEDSEEKKEDKVDVKALWDELKRDFRGNQKVSNDLYDRFEEMGIPSDIVDDFTDGLVKEQEAFTNSVYEMAGGQDEFFKIKAWAEDGNIPASQLAAMETMSYDQIILAMGGIKAKYDSVNKSDGSKERINGKSKQANVGNGYDSVDAYMSDVADPRYNIDAKYRAAVDKKFARSKF